MPVAMLLALYAAGPFSMFTYVATHLSVCFMETYQLVLVLAWLALYVRHRGRWYYYLATFAVSILGCLVHHTFCCTLFPLMLSLMLFDAFEGGRLQRARAAIYGADVLLMLGLPFVATQNAISYWPFGPVLCRLVMTLDGINQFTSIFCLTVMSVDRYLAVVHPIRSARWRRPRVAKLASAAVWAFSLVMSLPLVVFADIQEGWNTCNLSWPEPVGLWGAVFIIYTSVLGFFGPLLVICLCYVLIVVKLKASGVRVGSTRRRSERKVTRMVVVVVLVFAGCWLPFFIVNIVNLAFALPEEPASAGAYFFVVVLSYANSCANPLLYGFLSDNFRQSFRKVLCLRKGYGAGAEDADATEPRPGPSSRLQEATTPMRSCKANGLMQTSKL